MPEPSTLVASARMGWKLLSVIPQVTGPLLRWKYPIILMPQHVLIELDAHQARFELRSGRPSHALTSLKVNAHNHLPFGIKIEVARIVVNIHSYRFFDGSVDQCISVPSSASSTTTLPELALSDQQVRWLEERHHCCANARIDLQLKYFSQVWDWEDSRPFVCLASINTDRDGKAFR